MYIPGARAIDDSHISKILEEQEMPPIIEVFVVECRREHNMLPPRVWCNRDTWIAICDWFKAKYPEGAHRAEAIKGMLGSAVISSMLFLENPNLEFNSLCTDLPRDFGENGLTPLLPP